MTSRSRRPSDKINDKRFRTNGPSNQWVFGSMGNRTNRFSDQWVFGPMGFRANGSSNQWAVEPSTRHRMNLHVTFLLTILLCECKLRQPSPNDRSISNRYLISPKYNNVRIVQPYGLRQSDGCQSPLKGILPIFDKGLSQPASST